MLALVAAGPLAATPATAHCPEDGRGEFQGTGQSTCPANTPLEKAINEANRASGSEEAYVLVKDKSFHPPVVHVADGGSVTFVWADTDQQEEHEPQSSGAIDDGCENVHEDPTECAPKAPGACFAQDAFMNDVGERYTISLRTNDAGNVEVSEGPVSGTPLPFAPPFYECPENTAVDGPETSFDPISTSDSVVIPFHCSNHGLEGTSFSEMRGAIVLEE
jgi:hypothetical protein